MKCKSYPHENWTKKNKIYITLSARSIGYHDNVTKWYYQTQKHKTGLKLHSFFRFVLN
jgi:hypothetical protein